MLSKEGRLFYSLYGIKQVLMDLGAEDIKNEVKLKDGSKETIDCYNELDKFIIDFINVQYKFGKMDIMILLNSILDIDSKSENKCFPVIKKFRILTDEDYDKLHNYENPQPYKYEDLKPGMWVWDENPECEEFRFIKIKKILSEFDCDYLYHDKSKKVFIDNMTGHAREFEEDRFFPITKALQYQEEEVKDNE